MTVYVYKSTTGFPVIIDNYIIAPEPGLQSKYQIEQLDTFIGGDLARYDDGVLVTADNSKPATITSSRIITVSDDGVTFNCSNALTITIPAGLYPKPSFIAVPPQSGNLSLAFSGGATGNGSAATQTFTRISNPTGVAVVAYEDGANGYGIGGGGSGGSSSAVITSVSAGFTVAASDDNKTFSCTTALPIAVPGGLTPKPSFIAIPPATGNLTLNPTGGTTFNGSASALTRTFANNRLGVAITPNPYDVNDYSVSGS